MARDFHLSNDLRFALVREIEKVPYRDVVQAVRQLSLRYRVPEQSGEGNSIRSDLDALAYVSYRLPATFGAISAVLQELNERRPDLEPVSLLDAGAGPGTALFAAISIWPRIEKMTALETDPHMMGIGKRLAAASDSSSIRTVRWNRVDLGTFSEPEAAQLTIAAYVLGEVSPHLRADFVDRLWECSADALVVIEPGTPAGFQRINRAGDQLAECGAHIISPFPPDWNCLDSPSDWCHFSQRVPRTSLLRRAKEGELSYEDEKYSYLIASRHPGRPIAARVTRHPQIRSGHIRLTLCSADGVRHVVISRRDSEAYRHARGLSWGSAILPEHAPLYGLAMDRCSSAFRGRSP